MGQQANNVTTIVGHLTKDPETVEVGDTTKTVFRVATDGSSSKRTTFVDVTAWGTYGTAIEPSLHKGSKIAVVGTLDLDEWEGPEGEKRSKHFVTATHVSFLDSRSTGDKLAERSEQVPGHDAPVQAF